MYLSAFDGDSEITYSSYPVYLEDESFEWEGGLDSWISFGELFRTHLFQQSWFYRVDGDTREYPIESLVLMNAGNTNPAGQEELDKILIELGDPSSDPIGIQLYYDLDETAPNGLGSVINESITLTSYSGAGLGVTLFAYTDLDLDNFFLNDTAVLATANTIRQTSLLGSTVDVRVTSGPNPNAFDISPYSNILSDLQDELITELGNNPQFGPGDATHAFQWNLTLDATPLTIGLAKEGAFADLVLPDDFEDGFFFQDDNPPTVGNTPRWYDPDVVVGYDYQVESSGNLFAELYLPAGFEDALYTLIITDPNHDLYGQEIEIEGFGQTMIAFDFIATDAQGDGVASFRVIGIEPEAMIDPNDDLGFPTGLTFMTSTPVGFRQSAITVPEPAGLAILIGLTALAGLRLKGAQL